MSRIVNSVTLVCYDIASDKLRRKIDKCLKDYGIRLQYSVFLCRIGHPGVERLRLQLGQIRNQFPNESNPQDSLIIVEHIPQQQIEFFFEQRTKVSGHEYEII
ncbi:CRISPR-associated endonuclease Cas2 [Acetobacterium wieringae]|uniref:CRISPR-associated endoribonuclease Cas2 n=1 Tax=Acetobacterium wieringae TaxID=52694 RepID=A0ABY6HAV3_9FIRM|nr:CRISPR-associated endonuclease Cas2 [Acetobacterium wieringae]UYO61628.1 CRISPR-associated endonuclease Cas2 [Acetobacterium wieringae]